MMIKSENNQYSSVRVAFSVMPLLSVESPMPNANRVRHTHISHALLLISFNMISFFF